MDDASVDEPAGGAKAALWYALGAAGLTLLNVVADLASATAWFLIASPLCLFLAIYAIGVGRREYDLVQAKAGVWLGVAVLGVHAVGFAVYVAVFVMAGG